MNDEKLMADLLSKARENTYKSLQNAGNKEQRADALNELERIQKVEHDFCKSDLEYCEFNAKTEAEKAKTEAEAKRIEFEERKFNAEFELKKAAMEAENRRQEQEAERQAKAEAAKAKVEAEKMASEKKFRIIEIILRILGIIVPASILGGNMLHSYWREKHEIIADKQSKDADQLSNSWATKKL